MICQHSVKWLIWLFVVNKHVHVLLFSNFGDIVDIVILVILWCDWLMLEPMNANNCCSCECNDFPC